MRVGSLVVCVDDSNIFYAKPLKKNKVYTVRSFLEDNSGIRVCEIQNEIHPKFNLERGYMFFRFREIDCPPSIDIEEIIELEQV